MAVTLEPIYLTAGKGRRFAILQGPERRPTGAVLLIPPLFEELNRTRRQCALAAAEMARAGFLTLRFDLFGTGDSDGLLEEATMEHWMDDISSARTALASRTGVPIVHWGVRAGALLGLEWMRINATDVPQLLWQPIAKGSKVVTQFLRTAPITSADGRSSTAACRAELESGRAVELAGYRLSPGLFRSLEAATIAGIGPGSATVGILDVHSDPSTARSAASQSLAQQLRDTGRPVTCHIVEGPAYWATPEVTSAPALTAMSVARLQELFV